MSTIRKTVMASLGLIQFPVAVQSAVRSDDVSLSGVCNQGHDPAPLVQPKSCSQCQATEGFGKARKEGKKLVVLTDTDLDALKPGPDVTTEMHFTVHMTAEVDTLTRPHGSLYYLSPHEGGTAYNVIRDVVAANPRFAFLTVWAPRSAPGLYRLVMLNDRLALSGVAWPEAILEAPEGIEDGTSHAALVTLASQFCETQVSTFEADTYSNDRAKLLADIVAAADGTTIQSTPAKKAKPNADDALLAALTASVAAAAVAS